MRPEKKDNLQDEIFTKPWDGEYLGNIWGWKVSIIAGVVLVIMVAWIVYAHVSTGTPFGMEEPEKLEQIKDEELKREQEGKTLGQ